MVEPARIENAVCIGETEKAILVDCPDFDEPKWLPKSMVEDESEVYEKSTKGILVVNEWWADKEGLV